MFRRLEEVLARKRLQPPTAQLRWAAAARQSVRAPNAGLLA